MSINLGEMREEDIADLLKLWRRTEGFGLDDVDSPEPLKRYLKRNAGLCFIAKDDEKIIGGVLCGHDGRRGYLHHVVVDPAYRGKGIGSDLVRECLRALNREGIDKCHSLIFASNEHALSLYEKLGWSERSELKIFSCFSK